MPTEQQQYTVEQIEDVLSRNDVPYFTDAAKTAMCVIELRTIVRQLLAENRRIREVMSRWARRDDEGYPEVPVLQQHYDELRQQLAEAQAERDAWRNGAMKVLDELAGITEPDAAPYVRVRRLVSRVRQLEAERHDLRNLYGRIFTVVSTGDPKHPVKGEINHDAKADFEAALESRKSL